MAFLPGTRKIKLAAQQMAFNALASHFQFSTGPSKFQILSNCNLQK